MEIHKIERKMTTAYLRYSTNKQDEIQQQQALQEWVDKSGATIDVIEKDEGVSGSVSYKDRKLYNLVKKMHAGDALVTTEISRLGRSMSDISEFLNKELKPRKIRIVIIKMGIDIDCSQMKAQDEFLFSALLFAAQIEREMIVQRTQSSIDARKEMLKRDGGFWSKTGRYCTHLGNKKGADMTHAAVAGAAANRDAAAQWRSTSPLFLVVENMVRAGKRDMDILKKTDELYKAAPKVYCTRTGKPLSQPMLSIWRSKYISYAI